MSIYNDSRRYGTEEEYEEWLNEVKLEARLDELADRYYEEQLDRMILESGEDGEE